MSHWNIYTTKNEEIAVVTPFHALVVAEAKRRMGRFTSIKIKEQLHKCWILDPIHREAMAKLCRDVFESELIERVIEWKSDGEYSYYSPQLDGYDLVWFGRDAYRINRFAADQPVRVLEILKDTLDSGGSRNNPKLHGALRLRVRCRAAAEAGGDGWLVDVVNKGG